MAARKKIGKLSLIRGLVQPLTGMLYHADFYEVDVKRKLTIDVPLRFVGKAVGVEFGGELQHLQREVKISCLPLNLPDHIDVDVASLQIGDSIRIRDFESRGRNNTFRQAGYFGCSGCCN